MWYEYVLDLLTLFQNIPSKRSRDPNDWEAHVTWGSERETQVAHKIYKIMKAQKVEISWRCTPSVCNQ